VDTTGATGSIIATFGRELPYLRLKDCPDHSLLASGVVVRLGPDQRQFSYDDVGADGQTRSDRYHSLPEVKAMS
jgi:hypothetical protein